jgi:hypothetical protein
MTQAFNLSQLANNLNTSGQLDATDGLTGAVPVANGGTGLTSVGTSGNVLTSNGSIWTSTAIPAPTIADGSITDPKIADGVLAGTNWYPLQSQSQLFVVSVPTLTRYGSARVLRGGTYRFRVRLQNRGGAIQTCSFRVYQNGVALGTTVSASVANNAFATLTTTSDVTLTSGSIVQFYFSSSGSIQADYYQLQIGTTGTLKILPVTLSTTFDNAPTLAGLPL